MKAWQNFPTQEAREASDHLRQAGCSHFLGNVLTSMGVQDFGFGIFFLNCCLFEV